MMMVQDDRWTVGWAKETNGAKSGCQKQHARRAHELTQLKVPEKTRYS